MGDAQFPTSTGMDTQSERFTVDGPGGKGCGDGANDGPGIGMDNVTDEFIAEEKTSCVEESGGGDSGRGDSVTYKRTSGPGTTKFDD